jgi:hypothetical protein
MDKLKAKIEEIVNKVKNDKDFASKFKSNPTEAVESILGIDIPDAQVEKVIDAVKAQLSNEKRIDGGKDLGSKLKGLFK